MRDFEKKMTYSVSNDELQLIAVCYAERGSEEDFVARFTIIKELAEELGFTLVAILLLDKEEGQFGPTFVAAQTFLVRGDTTIAVSRLHERFESIRSDHARIFKYLESLNPDRHHVITLTTKD
jgi:hypothetical protein